MAFKASKKREQRRENPIVGSIMRPSAAIRIWYQSELYDIIEEMVKDYRKEVNRALDTNAVQEFYATDAAASSVLRDVLGVLDNKWTNIFAGFAKSVSKKFVEQSDDYSKSSVQFSLSTAGIKQPRFAYTENVTNTINSSKDYNFTLVTGIQKEAHEKIYSSVMLSLTSPNPEEQGIAGIEAALKEMGGFSKKRAKLIATDQTSKLYSSLSDERLEENGVEEFEWMHSTAGKTFRKSHIEKDGMVFKLNDPRLWEGPKADQGPPGWAINCGCRKRPVII